MRESSIRLIPRVSTTARLMHHAPAATVPAAADFTLAQRVARYGLTVLAIASLSALFATQMAAMLR